MKLKGKSYFLIAIMAAMLFVIIYSLGMEYIESKLLPLIIGSIVLILAAMALVRDMWGKGKPSSAAIVEESLPEETGVGISRYLLGGAWVLGFFLAIYLLGFIIAIPLFVLLYTKLNGTSWIATIVLTVLTTGITYVLFEIVLQVDLYPGLLIPAIS
ncbi:tripartite tricarboxylate transporter TctB family protein [Chloroflexota bacterium]